MSSQLEFKAGDLGSLLGFKELPTVMPWGKGSAYELIAPIEQREIEASVDDEIRSRAWRTSGENDPEVWERGWAEVADKLDGLEKLDPFSLSPGYYRGERIFRLRGQYVRALADDLEFSIGLMLREGLLSHWLAPYPHVIEFGCGTGLNLFLLAHRFKEKRYLGCDWAKPVEAILHRIARATATEVGFCQYNMLTGSGLDDGAFPPGTAVCTVHAMEQLHATWEPFVRDMVNRRPAICVHLEPLVELYSSQNRFDELAIKFHQKRKYLTGFIPALKEMHRCRKVELIECRRVPFGGKFHEAYSVVVWKPL